MPNDRERAGLARTRVQVGGILCLLFCLLQISAGFSQPKSAVPPATPLLPPAQGEKEARELVGRLLASRPEKNTTNTGSLRIRQRDVQREIPVRFEITASPSALVSIYEARPNDANLPSTTLTVTQIPSQPNEYLLSETRAGSTNSLPKKLSGNETMIPFAGSDFWVADLGLEFLHWPKQRVLKKEMRRGQSCDILESTNPQPVPGAYSRVVSWVDIDSGGIVHADAYDAHNEVLKLFDPTELKKVNGERQLEEMEMRNRSTGSHTWIKFNLTDH
jgi:hypothetical protein